MNSLEKKIIDYLNDLSQNHSAVGIKAEFEDEGASFEEVSILKKYALIADLDLTVKIGGCGALNDIVQAKNMSVKSIVAPMIESAYALKKFLQSIELIYNNQQPPELFINIETINGYKLIDEILSEQESKNLTGVVVGRFDMAKSIGLECKDTNGDVLFDIVNSLSKSVLDKGLQLVVGGGVNDKSLDFFKKLTFIPNRFETRKILFNTNEVLNNGDTEAILKAIDFEMLWLKLKREVYGIKSPKDEKRLLILEDRQSNFFKNQAILSV